MKILRFIIILLIYSFTLSAYAQGTDTTVIAKIMLVQKQSGNKLITAISVTLTNTSDKDVYIPGLFSKARDLPRGAKLKTFIKKNDKYIRNGYYGTPIPDTSYKQGKMQGNPISGSRSEIIDKYLYIGNNKEKEMDSILIQFAKINPTPVKAYGYLEPLFLKAHEAYEINLIKDVDKLVNLPYEYKVIYELDYSIKNPELYPKEIMGYKLFIPVKLHSNILYLKVEP